jgi:hypothetical protein
MSIQLRTVVRIMPAVWFGVAICPLAVLYVTSLPPVDRYALAASATASAALPFVAAYVSAAAAWEGARMRRGGIWGRSWDRSNIAIAARPIAVPVVFGVLALLAAIAFQLARSGANAPDLRIVIVAIAELLAWAVVGFALGVRLPLAAAAPLALLLPYLWLGFVPAINPVWLRHITGMFRDCCSTAEDLSPNAVIASLIVSAGFAIAAWIVAVAPKQRLRNQVLIAAATTASVIVAAIFLVSGLTFAPVVARDSSLLACRKLDYAELCVWPEHQDRINELSAVTSEAINGWRAAALPTPEVVSEANRLVAPHTTLVVSFENVRSRDAAILALARGAVPPYPDCPSATQGVASATTGGAVEPYLEAWFASTGGLSPASMSLTYDGVGTIDGKTVSGVIDQVRSARPQQRARWVSKLVALLTTCDPVEPDVVVDP